MEQPLTPIRRAALIGLIDTPETVAAIYELDISDIHKLQVCNCLAGIQYRIGQGESPSSVMGMRYQDIVTGLKPTDTALTEAQRALVFDAIVTSVLVGLDALKADIIAYRVSQEDQTA